MNSVRRYPLLMAALVLLAACADQEALLGPEEPFGPTVRQAAPNAPGLSPANDYDVYVFEVEFPGVQTRYTYGRKINAKGDVVGQYQASVEVSPGQFAWRNRGFLLSGGEFRSIHVPGASQTYAYGINERGDIVGHFQDASDGRTYGFLLRDGIFTRVQVPGALGTVVRVISADGLMVGVWGDGTKQRGFLWKIGEAEPTILELPVAGFTAIWGANSIGDAVGVYSDPTKDPENPSGEWGFIRYRDGNLTYLTPPWPTRIFWPMDVSPSGTVVGSYTSPENPAHTAFVMDKHGGFSTFVVPGSYETYARSVSPSGAISGLVWFYDPEASPAWRACGFVATPLNPAGR